MRTKFRSFREACGYFFRREPSKGYSHACEKAKALYDEGAIIIKG